ncbi:hypothetical protein [Sphingobium aromaticiconvertens]|uniref:hypothetical protein n=1 Tax=Sphingobium aromaticiconvertens TaxID=365341 RepID=UPI003019D2F5
MADALEHRAEKWEPVFRKNDAITKKVEQATCVGFNAACSGQGLRTAMMLVIIRLHA